MNIPVNSIGVPSEIPDENKKKKKADAAHIDVPSFADKKLTPKQKMQIKIRKVKDKKPRQPFLIGGIALLLALFFLAGNISFPAVVPKSKDYKNSGYQFTFLGDVMMGRYVRDEGKKNGYEQFFENVKPVWKNSDYVFANLECSVLTNKNTTYTPLEKVINLYTDTEAVANMMDAGINAVSYANNHSGDYKQKAFDDAIKWFKRKDLIYSGYINKEAYAAAKAATDPKSPEAQYKPYTQIIAGEKKIGFIAVADVYNAKTIKYGLLTTADGDLNNYIYQSSQENDMTIVYAHWGVEYDKDITEKQTELAHQFVDAGADIVIGSHPHVLQNVEQYKNGMIFYSLGNFIMDQNNTFTCDSVIVQYNEDKEGKKSFELIPVRIVNGCPRITTSSFYKKRIQKELMSGMDSSKYQITDSGNIVINY